MAPPGRDLQGDGAEATLLRELTGCVLPSGPASGWQRRPSLAHDGTPILLSLKLAHGRDDEVRLIVEPGSLVMTVARQIAFSLTTVDRLLGLLSWRSAAGDLNRIAGAVLPADPRATLEWWGGVWLGAAVCPALPGPRPPAEMRIYLNLRHGDAAERWGRLAALLGRFSGPRGAVADEWLARVRPDATPVGLGAVVMEGRVRALRVYVVAKEPSSLVSLCQPISGPGATALTRARDGFLDEFDVPQSQSVTLGYDFLRGEDGTLLPRIGRVKVGLCFQGAAPKLRRRTVQWVERLLADWSLDADSLDGFIGDVSACWEGYDVEHVSLGFAPDPDHVTVYVKPRG